LAKSEIKIASKAEPKPGLRERKKQETRAALTAAALRLALRDGLDRLRVEDIADEANVSMRTFNNYFANKHEPLAAHFADRMRRAADALRARPTAEPLWESIAHAVLTPWESAARGHSAPDTATLAKLRIVFASSAANWEIVKIGLSDNNDFALAVGTRTGTDPKRELYPRLVAAAVTVATQLAVSIFLSADKPVPFVPLLREAVALLAAGLPDPHLNTAAGHVVMKRSPTRSGASKKGRQ